MRIMMAKKFAYMGGLPGCLPDYHSGFVYDDEKEAIDAASDMYELTEEETAYLGEGSPFYVRGERYHEIGAGVIEICSDMVEEEEGGKS